MIPGGGSPMSAANKAVVQRLIDDVLLGGKLDRIEEIIDPSHIVHDPSNPNRPGGIEGLKMFTSMFQAGLSDFEYHVEDMIAENDLVSYRWAMRARHTGPFMGIPPTGSRIAVTGMDMFRLKNGKIVESWAFADALGMLQQLGVLPPMGGPPQG